MCFLQAQPKWVYVVARMHLFRESRVAGAINEVGDLPQKSDAAHRSLTVAKVSAKDCRMR